MRKAKRLLNLVIILGIAFAIGGYFFMPVPDLSGSGVGLTEYKIATSLVLLLTWLHIGAAILFLNGTGNFKEQFRHGYKSICIALVVYGISLLQFPILSVFNLWQGPWSQYGGKGLPVLIGNIMFFVGLRVFAKAFGLHGWLMSFWTLLAAALISLPFAWLAPGERSIELVIDMVSVFIITIDALLAIRIYMAAGGAYKKSLRWFWLALAIWAIAQLLPAMTIMLRVPEGAFTAFGPAIAGILLVVAGYSFNKIGESFYTAVDDKTARTSATPIDVVLYMASLASSSREIDPMLDDVRVITSNRTSSTATFSPSEQAALIGVYRKLVTYLVEQDPLQVFDKPLLINKLRQKFAINTNDAWFWDNVK